MQYYPTIVYSRKATEVKLEYAFDLLEGACVAIVDILITADRGRREAYDIGEFLTRLYSFQTNVLCKLFPRGLRVIARSGGGRIHSHAAVAFMFSTDGVDWCSFDQAERWYKLYKATGDRNMLKWFKYYTKLYRASEPVELRELNRILRLKAKKYGFGRIFALPIRKNSQALKKYLVKNLPYTRQPRDRGVHFFTSWGLAKTGKFKVTTKYYNSYRYRLELFATGLNLTPDDYNDVLKTILGNNWHWKCREYIAQITKLHGHVFLPPHLQDGYEQLRRTVIQYIVRSRPLPPIPV